MVLRRPRYLPPAKFESSSIEHSIVAEGAIVLSSKITHSVIGLRFRVGSGSVIEDTVVMGCDYYETVGDIERNYAKGIPLLGVGKNCQIRRAILDKNVRIGDNVKIINKGVTEGHPRIYTGERVIFLEWEKRRSYTPSETIKCGWRGR